MQVTLPMEQRETQFIPLLWRQWEKISTSGFADWAWVCSCPCSRNGGKVSAAARAPVPSRPAARGNPDALRVRVVSCPTLTLLNMLPQRDEKLKPPENEQTRAGRLSGHLTLGLMQASSESEWVLQPRDEVPHWVRRCTGQGWVSGQNGSFSPQMMKWISERIICSSHACITFIPKCYCLF